MLVGPGQLLAGELEVGKPCKTANDCASALCLEVEGSRFCSQRCGECPDGLTCSPAFFHLPRASVCVPNEIIARGEPTRMARMLCRRDADCVTGGICAGRRAERRCTRTCKEDQECKLPARRYYQCRVDPAKKGRKACLLRKECRERLLACRLDAKGIMAILGTTGDSQGVVTDVFDNGLTYDGSLDGVTGVGIATNSESKQTTEKQPKEGKSQSSESGAMGGPAAREPERESESSSGESSKSMTIHVSVSDGDASPYARVVRARRRMVEDCYLREQKKKADLAGTIELAFEIDESGRVVEHRVSRADAGLEQVAACTDARVRRWRFPRAESKVEVNLTVELRPPAK
jgi:hypothetical protein